ncbi:MAG: thiamine pyrophosphate-binding protein [Lachnospiraceae bacterium]|nr:thiamine pyrophosphate-binding protein [Lachnospiraceae bacterium]
MKIKAAKYISQFLRDQGVTHIFTVTGGGAMHLNDAFGHQDGLSCIYNHHEQACAIAAEGYARYTGRVAGVCVTSGPGGTNAITGVLGGWQDSIPMFIVSGQVKRETTTLYTGTPVRQLGDQEFQIVDCAKTMTKYAVMVTEPEKIRYHLEKAWYLCNHGRKGPVWLDIPVDVQGAVVETDELVGFDAGDSGYASVVREENPVYDEAMTAKIIEKIRKSKRPVIFAGTGIRLGNAYREFIECIEALQIPVVTAWNAHDLLCDGHPLYCGRPGTVGTRGGNFVVQNCDLLLVLGSRLNIRLISYNYQNFAKDAYKIIVDIDEKELHKPTVKADMPIHADVKEVMRALAKAVGEARAPITGDHTGWLSLCREIDREYPAVWPQYYESRLLNPYVFLKEFTGMLSEGDAVICGNGSACVMTFQAAVIKDDQRLFTNSGCAAMGYGFPAAVGVCFARAGKRVICIDGDGSFQMNLQELQTVVHHHLNLIIVILNNNGYHSIRQTQSNLFEPPLVGVCADNGISFPDMEKLAYAYGIAYRRVDHADGLIGKLDEILKQEGPLIVEAVVDPNQNFEPKLASKALPDGTMVSPEPDDMYPFLPKEEYESVKRRMNAALI